MRKNKNKPETVDTASVTETEEIKVPKKKTDLHNKELSRKCSGNEL